MAHVADLAQVEGVVEPPGHVGVFREVRLEGDLLPQQGAVRGQRTVGDEDLIPEEVGEPGTPVGRRPHRVAYNEDAVDPVVGAEVEDDAVEDVVFALSLVVDRHRPERDQVAVGDPFRSRQDLLLVGVQLDAAAALDQPQRDVVSRCAHDDLGDAGALGFLQRLDANHTDRFGLQRDHQLVVIVEAEAFGLAEHECPLHRNQGVGEDRLAVGDEDTEELKWIGILGQPDADLIGRDNPAQVEFDPPVLTVVGRARLPGGRNVAVHHQRRIRDVGSGPADAAPEVGHVGHRVDPLAHRDQPDLPPVGYLNRAHRHRPLLPRIPAVEGNPVCRHFSSQQ